MNAISSSSMAAIKGLVLVLALAGSGVLASPTARHTSAAALARKHLAASRFWKSDGYAPSLARKEKSLESPSLKQRSDGSGVYESCPGGENNRDIGRFVLVCGPCIVSANPANCPSECCLSTVSASNLICEVNGWYLMAFRSKFLYAASGLEWSPQSVLSICY
jgi:hypothetical protein